MAEIEDLQNLRESIEQVDREILSQLKRRMELAEKVGDAKLKAAVPFRDSAREEQVLGRVRQLAVQMKLDPHQVERLYRLVLEMSIARQQAHLESLETVPLRVAYQGVEGSYSHLAAQRHYGRRKGGLLLSGHETLREAARAVQTGQADLALLPIENTSAGSLNETYELLGEGGITITCEVTSQVNHFLLALPGTQVAQLRTVLSHPQAFQQCEAFLRTVPWIHLQPEFDTAGAARKVQQARDGTLGAIASEAAGKLFGLEVLRAIPSQHGNFTRFVEVAVEAKPVAPEARCKTSLILVLDDRPGALGDVLSCFARRGVNLTKVESREVPGPARRYRFYLDLEGHAASAPVASALEELRRIASELRVLGTYPQAVVA